MYLICVRAHYDSAHFLRNYHGKCERLHGHRYEVEAAFAYEELGPSGMALDFTVAKRHLRAICDELDHQNINELPPFDTIEPSAENQARYLFEELRRRAGEEGKHLLYVRVAETPNQWAQYSERKLFI
jgi:6-pyruvoyltetrahydropterin/6-carboxytetrahydropterin synthase